MDLQRSPALPPVVSFFTDPDRYRHWRLGVDGEVATATLTVDESGALVAGYELKMNSYDLGVDIELYDLVQRLRFEHPGVKSVVMTGGLERMCCPARTFACSPSPHTAGRSTSASSPTRPATASRTRRPTPARRGSQR